MGVDAMMKKAIFAILAVVVAVVLASVSPIAQKKGGKVRIIQSNSAGANVHLIAPATSKVAGVIEGIEVNPGAGVAPDGSRIYVSNEAESTLDIVDAKTLKVIKRVPLTGHPNTMPVSQDGKRVYVGITQEPGGVNV